MDDLTGRQRGGDGPSSTRAEPSHSLGADAKSPAGPEPTVTTTEEVHAAVGPPPGEPTSGGLTRGDPSMGAPPGAGEVTQARDPTRTAIDDGTTRAQLARGPTPRAAPVIRGYEIEGELGRGGMGVVYKARHVLLNRDCALKMILAAEHAGAEAGARFLAEAEADARLRHPNIVQIYHIGEHDGQPYFEMEYVDGGSLVERLDGTPRRTDLGRVDPRRSLDGGPAGRGRGHSGSRSDTHRHR